MIQLRPWSTGDLPLLQRGNTADMTAHLGGPESADEVQRRHNNYLRYWEDGSARMFVILTEGEAVGSIGWWSTTWRDAPAHEAGWFVLPEAQGRGHATGALRILVNDARDHGTHRWLTAFPAVENGASNGICERTGFRHSGVAEFPFRGAVLRVNEWALDLERLRAAP